ncbi:unnamed protein product [Moneuplotes crassus]|uniref:Protein kinase domain-containing protein n=1 Tax=Euplotes crassus TaxID=5936 RepID=A0AAD1Y632_EUPCR|nr:unnamed protein product [Moneuplotes crassus]
MGSKVCICKDYLESRKELKRLPSQEEAKKAEDNNFALNGHDQVDCSYSLGGKFNQKMSFRSGRQTSCSLTDTEGDCKFEIFEEYKNEPKLWKDNDLFINKDAQNLFSIYVNKQPIGKHYKIGKVLGSGNYAIVKQACSHANPSFKVAVKIYKLDGSINEQLSIFRELSAYQSFDHPNLVKVHEVFLDTKKLYIVCDLVKGKRLYDYILDSKKIPEDKSKVIARQLLRVVQYCHFKNIMHRDLKPENIIIDPETLQVKVIDFGSSSYFSSYQNLKTSLGTPYYIAPEVLKGKYGKSADTWSIGIVTYLMLTGCPPFQDEDFQAIYQKILKEPLQFYRDQWIYLSQNSMKFVSQLLVKDPAERVSIEDALKHPWFEDILGQDISFTCNTIQKLLNKPQHNILRKEILNLVGSQINSRALAKWNKLYAAIYSKKVGMASLKRLEKLYKKLYERFPEAYTISAEILCQFRVKSEKYICYRDFLSTLVDFQNDIPYFSMETALAHMGVGSGEEISNAKLEAYLTRRGFQDPDESAKILYEQIMNELNDQGSESLVKSHMLCQDSFSEESGTFRRIVSKSSGLSDLIDQIIFNTILQCF